MPEKRSKTKHILAAVGKRGERGATAGEITADLRKLGHTGTITTPLHSAVSAILARLQAQGRVAKAPKAAMREGKNVFRLREYAASAKVGTKKARAGRAKKAGA